jgi:hypothetical protein
VLINVRGPGINNWVDLGPVVFLVRWLFYTTSAVRRGLPSPVGTVESSRGREPTEEAPTIRCSRVAATDSVVRYLCRRCAARLIYRIDTEG